MISCSWLMLFVCVTGALATKSSVTPYPSANLTDCPAGASRVVAKSSSNATIKCLPHLNTCGDGGCCIGNGVDYYCCSGVSPCPTYNSSYQSWITTWQFNPHNFWFTANKQHFPSTTTIATLTTVATGRAAIKRRQPLQERNDVIVEEVTEPTGTTMGFSAFLVKLRSSTPRPETTTLRAKTTTERTLPDLEPQDLETLRRIENGLAPERLPPSIPEKKIDRFAEDRINTPSLTNLIAIAKGRVPTPSPFRTNPRRVAFSGRFPLELRLFERKR